MTYYERITASKTWTCPKTGRYKIICVGGGSSGRAMKAGDTSTSKQNAGGTTSFGSYVSATGGAASAIPQTIAAIGGTGGYTGIAYGGVGACKSSSETSSTTTNGGNLGSSGFGRGAGGGAYADSNSGKIASGACGELSVIELDLTVNQTITCTIGQGGAAVSVTDSNHVYNGTAGTAGCIDIRFIQ